MSRIEPIRTVTGGDAAYGRRRPAAIVAGRGIVPVIFAVMDVIAIFTAYQLVYFAFEVSTPGYLQFNDFAVGIMEPMAFVFAVVGLTQGLYGRPGRLLWAEGRVRLSRVFMVWCLVFAMTTVLLFLFKAGAGVSRLFAVSFFVAGAALLVAGRLAAAFLVTEAFRRGAIAPRNVALIAIGEDRWSGVLKSDGPASGLALRQIWQVRSSEIGRVSGELGQSIMAELRSGRIDELLIGSSRGRLEHVRRVAGHLRLAPLRVRMLADPRMVWLTGLESSRIGDMVAIEISREPLSPFERAAKRVFDVVLAALALVALSPLLAIVAVAVRLETPGPVLFRQHRDGFNGKPFLIFKFRSMRVIENGPNVVQAKRGDRRVTRVGAFIRRTSIDELPQLLNVLRGEMSLVGPRPHAVAHGRLYSEQIAAYAHRHHVKPGITGWAQVNGSRGETPTVDSMKERVAMDIWYIGNWSFMLDLRIILRTILLVFTSRHAAY